MTCLSEFLANTNGFKFYLFEYLEARQVVLEVRRDLDSFRAHFGKLTVSWDQLRDQFSELSMTIPAYRGVDSKLKEYQNSIELCRKHNLIVNADHYRNELFDLEALWVRPTSGTTGEPISIYYSPFFFFAFNLLVTEKIAHVVGLNAKDQTNPVHSLFFNERIELENRVCAVPDDKTGVNVRQYIDITTSSCAEDAVDAAIYHQPTIITAKPETLYALSQGERHAKAEKLSTQFITSSGSELHRYQREQIMDYWNIPVINVYGLSECGVLASECNEMDGLHLFENESIFEILLGSGEMVSTGVGELVVSNFRNIAMPLLRFATGDRVEVINTACSCGKEGRRMYFLERVIN